MVKMDLSLLRRKFRGSMLGVLSGDCLGSPYENENILSSGEKIVLQKSLDKLEGQFFKAPVMQFTDDSAMTRSVAESLIEKRCLDLCDVAKKFVKTYYQEPHRGYGPGVVTVSTIIRILVYRTKPKSLSSVHNRIEEARTWIASMGKECMTKKVFQKLKRSKYCDILQPAKEQFNGEGSLGNGGAMRIAPIALFCHSQYDKLIETARRETEITHTHKMGVDGAILQAIAIQQCLMLNPENPLDRIKFVQELIEKMNFIEVDEEGLDVMETQPFIRQLRVIKNLLKEEGEGPHALKVVEKLGNDVTAIHSVPTAIFCFLRAQKPIEGIKTDNPLRRAIQYAICLGGDTDTIAAMTGGLAGAFYGDTKINSLLLEHCEASAEFRNLGDSLYRVSMNQ